MAGDSCLGAGAVGWWVCFLSFCSAWWREGGESSVVAGAVGRVVFVRQIGRATGRIGVWFSIVAEDAKQ